MPDLRPSRLTGEIFYRHCNGLTFSASHGPLRQLRLLEANFGQDNFAGGVPVGITYHQHAIQAGCRRQLSQNVSVRLQYGFFSYASRPAAEQQLHRQRCLRDFDLPVSLTVGHSLSVTLSWGEASFYT